MNIMTVTSGDLPNYPTKYYIDCPIDVEMSGPELRRIEIPRALAIYISNLQHENERLKNERRS